MESYKQEYNHLLIRWYNGLEYIKNHPEEEKVYGQKIIEIQNRLEQIIEEYSINDEFTILNGFRE